MTCLSPLVDLSLSVYTQYVMIDFCIVIIIIIILSNVCIEWEGGDLFDVIQSRSASACSLMSPPPSTHPKNHEFSHVNFACSSADDVPP